MDNAINNIPLKNWIFEIGQTINWDGGSISQQLVQCT